MRHSHECLATVVRMQIKLQLHSCERRETFSRMFRDCCTRDIFSNLDRSSRIVENKSRTTVVSSCRIPVRLGLKRLLLSEKKNKIKRKKKEKKKKNKQTKKKKQKNKQANKQECQCRAIENVYSYRDKPGDI